MRDLIVVGSASLHALELSEGISNTTLQRSLVHRQKMTKANGSPAEHKCDTKLPATGPGVNDLYIPLIPAKGLWYLSNCIETKW